MSRSLGRRVDTRVHCAFATADPITISAFLMPHVEQLLALGARVSLISGPGGFPAVSRSNGAQTRVIRHLRRNPSPWADLRAVFASWRALKHDRVDAIHIGTPKAGLVVGLAAALARVRRRIYTIHGLRYETMSGLTRTAFRLLERMSCALATEVVAVSRSAADAAVRDGVVRRSKIQVLGEGSISGVDAARYGFSAERRSRARSAWGVTEEERVVLFVGRLSADKGVEELPTIWRGVRQAVPDARLVVIGAVDSSQPPSEASLRSLADDSSVVLAGHVHELAGEYSGADLLVLPTRREGFGSVVLEAAAAGVATVGSDVTGVRDAVIHGETGMLVPPGLTHDWSTAIAHLLIDREARTRLGEGARVRAETDFSQELVVARYTSLLLGSA